MLTVFKGLLYLILFVALSGCGETRQKVIRKQIYAFGTIVDVSFWGISEQKAELVFDTLTRDLEYMHVTWHAWHPGAVARTNQLVTTGLPFTLAPSVFPLIQQSKQLYKISQGLFNPAMGELVAMWGFAQDEPPLGPPPAHDKIQAYLADLPTMDDIQIEGVSMRSANRSLRLNFGAFAKGYAVNMLMDRLFESNISNAIINAGGDLKAIGRKGKDPWRIGIRHPAGDGVLASIEVAGDESVFTSGDYERFYEYDGQRYHHIIDPRTGYPAVGTRSVTVVHADAALADAAATALFVAGPDGWPQIAQAMGIKLVMLVSDDSTVYMTPQMQSRIHFEVEPKPATIIKTLP